MMVSISAMLVLRAENHNYEYTCQAANVSENYYRPQNPAYEASGDISATAELYVFHQVSMDGSS